ncbi:DUF3368 domain-containing protein [Exilibacterium tricleocarpae]|uniref:DUF3368 domain-containing protein n=1 Tax=Exilibacterium tricleocarpae TaxID=2591008 RepID=A0A545TSI9_9GAMM|nr:DUF3368 domain-containing protein [Exilibacterium tricleocarpae]
MDLLNSIAGLFKAVYVTPGVVQECTKNKTMPGAVKIALALEQGILLASSDFDTSVVETLNLDRGESESIALALAYKCPLLIDERKGRRIAKKLGLDIVGIGAALVIGKNHGVIESIAPLLQQLGAMGIYLSEKVKSQILSQADEK